jgi:hypothetical protein
MIVTAAGGTSAVGRSASGERSLTRRRSVTCGDEPFQMRSSPLTTSAASVARGAGAGTTSAGGGAEPFQIRSVAGELTSFDSS